MNPICTMKAHSDQPALTNSVVASPAFPPSRPKSLLVVQCWRDWKTCPNNANKTSTNHRQPPPIINNKRQMALFHIHSSLGYRPPFEESGLPKANGLAAPDVDIRIFHQLRVAKVNRCHYAAVGVDPDAHDEHIVVLPSWLRKHYTEGGPQGLLEGVADTGIGKVLRRFQVAHVQIPFPLNDRWALAVVNISQSHMITGYVFGEREHEDFASPDDINYLLCALQSLWAVSGLDLSVSPCVHLSYQAIPQNVLQGARPAISVLPSRMPEIITSSLYYSRYCIEPFEGLQVAEPQPGLFKEHMNIVFDDKFMKQVRVSSKDLATEKHKHQMFKWLEDEGIELPFKPEDFESHPQLLVDWVFWSINFKFLDIAWVVPFDITYEITMLLLMHVIETESKQLAEEALNMLFDITTAKDLVPFANRLPTYEQLHQQNTNKKDGPKFKNKKKGVLVSINNNQGLLMVSPSGFLLRRESLTSNEWRLSGSNAELMNHRLFNTGFDESTLCDYLGVQSFKLVHKENCKYCDEHSSTDDEAQSKKKIKLDADSSFPTNPSHQLQASVKKDYIKIGQDESSKSIEHLLPMDQWYQKIKPLANELIKPLDPEVFTGGEASVKEEADTRQGSQTETPIVYDDFVENSTGETTPTPLTSTAEHIERTHDDSNDSVSDGSDRQESA